VIYAFSSPFLAGFSASIASIPRKSSVESVQCNRNLYENHEMAATQEPWQEIAARKRASVRALIPAQWLIPAAKLEEYKKSERGVLHVPRESGILSAEEIKITESYDAVALAEELRAGRLSAVDVTRAFSKRAAIAQQLVG
jgi:hypothetical protein